MATTRFADESWSGRPTWSRRPRPSYFPLPLRDLQHCSIGVIRSSATSHDRAILLWERFRDARALRQLGDRDDFGFLAAGFSPDIGRAM